MSIGFGREVCGDLPSADQREWLITNGRGSYASGTVSGCLTRSYHGLLVAALDPPLHRTLLVSKVQETVHIGGESVALSTDRWQDGSVDPRGHERIESFTLDEVGPVWRYAIADALIEKRIWMPPHVDATCVRYRWLRGGSPLNLTIRVLVNHRSHHGGPCRGDLTVEAAEGGARVSSGGTAAAVMLRSDRGEVVIPSRPEWIRGFALAMEARRGLPCRDDHLGAAGVEAVLGEGEPTLTLTLGLDTAPPVPGSVALRRRRHHSRQLLERWRSAQPVAARQAPDWIEHLVLAADQFVVGRGEPGPHGQPGGGHSLIAGYPWFNDWGRDTMISLPGLTLVTGRGRLAADILRTYAAVIRQGLIPNLFEDPCESVTNPRRYNSVDATLWFIKALRDYRRWTGDLSLIAELYPVLASIVDHHLAGTRHGIRVDPADGLLRAGDGEMQLTWMDACDQGRAVTPRHGKPIEVNALWIHALMTMEQFAAALGEDPHPYSRLAGRARQGFQRFWSDGLGHCFDVLDGPGGRPDPSLRPNQLIALALPETLLNDHQARQILRICSERLLTSHGLRSLDPLDPRYRGQYRGGWSERDRAYHQGTVWGWLLGSYALAHARVHGRPLAARRILEPTAHHLRTAGLGSISEIFDGAPPHHPGGCIAQAWSVGEVLLAWVELTLAAD